MNASNVIDLRIVIKNYIEIKDFYDLSVKTKINSSLLAALVGCIEGIITPSEDKSCFTFLEINKKDISSQFMFQDMYSFITENKIAYNNIINYFNMWHGKKIDMFTYDDYHLHDIMNNIFRLKLILDEEYELAKEHDDSNKIILYEQALRVISKLMGMYGIKLIDKAYDLL